jgi:hypothetical protein
MNIEQLFLGKSISREKIERSRRKERGEKEALDAISEDEKWEEPKVDCTAELDLKSCYYVKS